MSSVAGAVMPIWVVYIYIYLVFPLLCSFVPNVIAKEQYKSMQRYKCFDYLLKKQIGAYVI